MRFAFLGSGSRGNGLLIEAGGTCILLDCGFSERETRRRLAVLGKTPQDLAAIVVTHEHTDHFSGVVTLSRRHQLSVWTTHGTVAAADADAIHDLRLVGVHDTFNIGDMEVQPFPVPHDAREPCQYVFSEGRCRLGVLTDTGVGTPHIEHMLGSCDALVLESNHDTRMLEEGSYPPYLKQRVGGRLGHLSNEQAAGILSAIDCSRLQHLVAAHLSEKNNTPKHARQALSSALGCTPDWISVAGQDNGLPWRDIL